MAVKLDILLNYIFNNRQLKQQVAEINKMMLQGIISPRGAGGAKFGSLREMFKQEIAFLDHKNKIYKDMVASINKLNKGGFFQDYIVASANKSGRRKNLTPEEVKALAKIKTNQQLYDEAQAIQDESDAWEENKEFDEKKKKEREEEMYRRATEQSREDWELLQEQIKNEKNEAEKQNLLYKYDLKMKLLEAAAWKENERYDERKKIQERRDQEQEARKRDGERKWNIKMNKLHAQALEENKRRDDDLRKRQLWALFGRWGKLGIWGFVASQAIKYISKAVNAAYQTSMQGLDWQRTISGGAAGGTWFGQGLAAYQRAGLGANQLQGFKRGIQGYLGSVKLGMGNAAPLMYLGLSALGDPDELERQLERSLRRLPKDVSLALAGQMGLDYNMWEAIYSGRLDRERSAYSEQAMKEWAELAKGMNELLTNINVFFFNYLAPMMGAIGEFLQQLSEGKTGIGQSLDIASGYVSRAVKVALAPIEIVLKNTNGEVIQTATATPQNEMIEQTAKEYSI